VRTFPLFVVFSCGMGTAAAQDVPLRTFSLASRAEVTLPGEWSRRLDLDPPPRASLASSAPRISFTDFLVLENRGTPAVLELAYSSNPFFGLNFAPLEAKVHESFISDFFYFFFPPPRGCLSSAKAAFDTGWRKQEEDRHAEKGKDTSKDSRAGGSSHEPLRLARTCDFSLAPLDFFSREISPGIVYQGTPGEEHVEPRLRTFYLPPMEQVEIDGKTFFIFEARGDHMLEFDEVQRFGLPDHLRGARAHFFWAIGASSPFPFLRDPQRKDLQIFHLAYACLGFDGEARQAFHAILGQTHFNP
jgi:hypothetical protein